MKSETLYRLAIRSFVVVAALSAGCSLFVPSAVAEGEGDSGEGEGDVVGEGEGDVVGEGEGEGEGEGDVVGEGEGEINPNEGCRDGSDDGFNDLRDLRACSGTWTAPGIYQTSGADTAANLCAEGWHVCLSDAEVKDALVLPDNSTVPCNPGIPGIFVTRQGTGSGGGCAIGANDVIGCSGTPTSPGELSGCNGVNTRVGGVDAAACNTGGFSCSVTNGFDEGQHLLHSGNVGGVLCCRGAETNACIQTIGLGVDPDANADLGADRVVGSISLDRAHDAIVRFRSPQLYDGNFTSADVVFGPSTSGPNATFSVSSLNVIWDEASANAAEPSSGAAWPGNYPGDPVGTANPNQLGYIATVPLSTLRDAPFRVTGATPELNFVLHAASEPMGFAARDTATNTKLRMNRCVRLAKTAPPPTP